MLLIIRMNYHLFSGVHEKCFMIFMAGSFFNMLLIIVKYSIFRDYLSPATTISLRLKVVFFVLGIFFVLNLVVFYEIHIMWCVDNGSYNTNHVVIL